MTLLSLNYIEIKMQGDRLIISLTPLGEINYHNMPDEIKHSHSHKTTIHQNIVVNGNVIDSAITHQSGNDNSFFSEVKNIKKTTPKIEQEKNWWSNFITIISIIVGVASVIITICFAKK